MKISFCITCKNRIHQIRKTLPKNLEDNRMGKNSVEFILVDFDSSDGLQEWVINSFKKELSEGYLKFFSTKALPNWRCSIAKNTAHIAASNDILVNLDCDNYTGHQGGNYILKQFKIYGTQLLLHQYSGNILDGSYGRISMMRKHFIMIGGYDESFFPMGYQDIDLIKRLHCLGLLYINKTNPEYNRAISNTKEDSILNTNSNMTFKEMNTANRTISERNIKSGNICANNGIIGIQTNIYRFVENKFIKVGLQL